MSIKQHTHFSNIADNKQRIRFLNNKLRRRISDICQQLKERVVQSSAAINSVDRAYTGTVDTVQYQASGPQMFGSIKEMHPLAINVERNPDAQENQSKRRKIDTSTVNPLVEVETLKKVRRRTFSHWSHRQMPSAAQMISAGFFNCNVGDRVICLYCNLICQQWISNVDDPQEVHQTLSPHCPFVLVMLKIRQTAVVSILNESSADNTNDRSRTSNILRLNEIVHASACHVSYMEIPKRQASFTSWPQELLPSVDDLVRAGFFYTGTKTVVTCFYCNGSLQNWGPKDNPAVEHCRWFPHCAYAKQLCGDELYRKIQESKRIAQERVAANPSNRNGNDHATNSSRLEISDESILSRFVAARLDLPISQSLLERNFKLSIIKRCWEDQFRLKEDDFASDCDLFVACIILQKQIDHINGNKENIIVPSVKIKMVREKEQAETLAREEPPSSSFVPIDESSQTQNLSNEKDTEALKSTTILAAKEKGPEVKTSPATSSSSSNLCALCLTEEKRLACIPCGHLATCVPCGHSLRTCPICRKEIEAFVRIYI